jgi:hypothetical protein
MAKRVFKSANLTWTAFNAGVAASPNAFMAIKGGSATQITDVLEVEYSGKAVSSIVGAIEFGRVSVADAGTTTLLAPNSDGPMNPATAALAAPVVTYTNAGTTQPTPSNTVTDAKLNLAMNLFGGLFRWNASPLQQWTIIGNNTTLPGGESIMFNNALAGGLSGAGDGHIIYETY